LNARFYPERKDSCSLKDKPLRIDLDRRSDTVLLRRNIPERINSMSEEQKLSSPNFWSMASELPHDVFSVWRKPDFAINPVAIVATIDLNGSPRVAPYGSLRAVTPTLLRLCSLHAHDTYANLCRDGRVSVCLISPGIAVSASGWARVVREHMELEPSFAILDIDIHQVKNDMAYRIEIESGIAISAKEQFKPWYDAAMAELDAVDQSVRREDL
jgi:hypothetical protein